MGLISDTAKATFRIAQTGQVIGKRSLYFLRHREVPPARLLRQTFEDLGATYIKLGQFIASSPTLFPESYVEEFQTCLDQTPPLPFRRIQRILRDELGDRLDDFTFIDPEPLASASIAQVHTAVLRSGEEVVIKVQKPGVRNTLVTDLNFLYIAARVLETLAPKLSWTSLSGIIEEIQKTMMEECDFYQEAKNLQEFAAFLESSGIENVVVPQVYPQQSALKVLTMERFHGVPLTDLETIRQYCPDPEQTLISAMNTWFASLTRCRFFHADVHAGNLMVLQDGRVGFIDFGIVGRIREGTWQAISDFITAMMMNHFQGIADALIRIGVAHDDVDREQFALDIEALYRRMDDELTHAAQGHPSVEDDDVNQILMDLVKIGETHGIHFPREFALLLKQFLYFDRYVHILAPEMDMFVDERLNLLQ